MSIQDYFAGKTVLLTGATGLVGRVLLEKILRDLPDVHRVYVLIRPKAGRSGSTVSAEGRLSQEILGSSAFDPLRQLQGEAFSALAAEKIVAVAGDLSEEHLGLDAPPRQQLQEEVQVIINCAAVVAFDAALGTALELNTLGPLRVLEFARGCKEPIVAHVSTCYVNGTRQGPVGEETLDPTQDMVHEDSYDVDEEVRALSRLIQRMEERSHSIRHRVAFALGARRRRNGRGNTTQQATALAAERLRQAWVEQWLVKEGMRWSHRRGWNDIYTFTKAMGEQMLMRHREDIPLLIFRPSIIESAFESPAPGWLDGLRMLDPLIVAYGRKQLPDFPGNPEVIVDVVPVDMVVNALLASIPAVHSKGGHTVYQVATGTQNPLTFRDFCDLVREAFLKEPLSGRTGSTGTLPSITFPSTKRFLRRLRLRYLLPLRVLESVAWLVSITPWGRRLFGTYRSRRAGLQRLAYWAQIYSPYSNALCQYQTQGMTRVLEALSDEERQRFNFDVTRIDWRNYFQDIHIPGVKRFLLGIAPKAVAELTEEDAEILEAWEGVESGAQARADQQAQGIREPTGAWRRHPLISSIPSEREVKRWLGARWLWRPVRAAIRWLVGLGYRYYLGFQCGGLEHVPASGPFIVASNHSSHLDTGALMTVLGKRIHDLHPVAAQDYFFRDRLWSWASRTLIDAIPLNRQTLSTEGLGLAVALLRQNHSLLYYPEGGRSATGEMQPFKTGIGLLAVESGAPIVPANISGSFEALAKGRWLPKRHSIRVRIGAPIYVEPYLQSQGSQPPQELAKRITEDVQKAVEALC